MSSGKKKKKKQTPASGRFPIIPALIGLVVVAALIGGGIWVMGQRKSVVGYAESVTAVTSAIKARDPESPAGSLKLSEVAGLIQGAPEMTRETQDGAEYAVYTWPGSVQKTGFRLKIEKNGPIDEVVELVTLNLK